MTAEWQNLTPSGDLSHHINLQGVSTYKARFDAVLPFHAPGLAPVQREKEAWHIRPDGQPAYTRRFNQTFGFYENVAGVVGNSGWHHILPTGDDAYTQRYAWCGNFQEGRCTVRQSDDAYLHIMPTGEPAYATRWRYAGDFRNGIGVVQAADGRSTHIDEHGNFIHPCWLLDLDVFHKGFARARDESGWMHINLKGSPAYPQRFSAVEPFYNGQARVERFDGGLDVINESGTTIIELRSALRSEFAALSSDMVGFWRTQTIAAAVELGVFEALPGSVATIANHCVLQPDRAQRLLRALTELSLVAIRDDQWHATPRGKYLRADHALTLADAANEYGRYFPRMWEMLPEAMRANGQWAAPDIFADIAQDNARREPHHRMLRSYARHDYVGVPEAMKLQGDEHIVDAGGGLAILATGLLEHYPKLHVTLLDRPEVIEQAKKQFADASVIQWQTQDLFESWDIEADVVVLARVLHDWDDADMLQILKRARDALTNTGKLFVLEMVLAENDPSGCLCDLHLLMSTGGQERTVADYAALMAQASFTLLDVHNLQTLPSILVGVPQ